MMDGAENPVTIRDFDSTARAAFTSAFAREPEFLATAPSRVELLGNHTDYNGGLVLAAAIDRFTAVAGRAMEDRAASVLAANFDGQRDAFSLATPVDPGQPGDWRRYVRGVCWAL